MLTALRRTLRHAGIALPFSDVICPEHAKAICIDSTWRAEATVRQRLVFLDVPRRGELEDICPLEGGATADSLGYHSPDSVEIRRRRAGRQAVSIRWEPKSPVTRYALYEHQHSWALPGSFEQLALFTEFEFRIRTGLFVFEMITPQAFEAAVVFQRPNWTLLNTERKMVKYALKQLDAGAERANILDHGARVEWRILGPRMGVRYICAAFHANGAVLWKDRLKKSSFMGGMRQLFARPSSR